MRNTGLTLIMLAATAGAAWAQQELPPSADQGPMNIKPAQPTPDKDGVYAAGPGITPPQLVRAEPAVHPAEAPAGDYPTMCVFSAVIGADGTPSKIQVARGCGNDLFAASGKDAIQRSQFQPGSLNGKPVPVLTHVRILFRNSATPAIPRLAPLFREGFGGGREGFGAGRPYNRDYDKPPVALHVANAEFSEEARRKKVEGVVIVSVLVNEEGVPIDPRVEKGLGYGLDEKALQCALEYRFKPAMKDGAPVATRIAIEVNFKLY